MHGDAARSQRLPRDVEGPIFSRSRRARPGDAATVSLADADLGAAFADFGWSGFHGSGDVEANLSATGFAASDSILSLAGEASATLSTGAIDEISVEEALRRSLRRPIDVARDLGNGAMRFSLGRLRLKIATAPRRLTKAF